MYIRLYNFIDFYIILYFIPSRMLYFSIILDRAKRIQRKNNMKLFVVAMAGWRWWAGESFAPIQLSTDDMTRECLEKREMVFYMFFMCFNTAEKKERTREKLKRKGKEKYKRNGSRNYGMRRGVSFFTSKSFLFFRAEDKKLYTAEKKEKQKKATREHGVEVG